jgi:hypothetical protein
VPAAPTPYPVSSFRVRSREWKLISTPVEVSRITPVAGGHYPTSHAIVFASLLAAAWHQPPAGHRGPSSREGSNLRLRADKIKHLKDKYPRSNYKSKSE